MDWLRFLFELSGLPILEGSGRYLPILGEETRWAIEHVRKYPEPGQMKDETDEEMDGEWTVIKSAQPSKDRLHFI